MKYTSRPNYFIAIWLLLNLLQAAFSELTSDEGYYWFYTRHLEWGYYDHPPFLALIVKIGYYFFHNEFGVRVVNVLLTSAGLWVLFKLIPKSALQKKYIYILLLSLPLLHYLSFIIFPDGPLLFFTAVYLWSYKKFIDKNDGRYALIMGTAVALMIYSKYHGILIVIFTLLSNPRLLQNKYFYFAMLLALLLFTPHIWWQYRHNFVTLDYHLQKRTDELGVEHIFEYVSQQILAIGPGFIFIPFLYKVKGQFEKTLQYIIIGTLLFFLFASLKGQVYFHWTSIILFPVILLAVNYYDNNNKKKLFYWLMLPFLLVISIARLQMMFPILSINHVNVDYYHGRKFWAKDIVAIAHNNPVLFSNDFRESSLYSFYSGNMGVALFSGDNRRSQYEIWDYEDSIQEKKVLYISKDSFPESITLTTRMGKTLYYYIVSDFHSFYNIPVIADFPRAINKGKETYVQLMITNSRKKTLYLKSNNLYRGATLFCIIKKGNAGVGEQAIKTFLTTDSIPVNSNLAMKVKILTSSLTRGKYNITFGFKSTIPANSYNAVYYFTVK